jgi:hypothetical protein
LQLNLSILHNTELNTMGGLPDSKTFQPSASIAAQVERNSQPIDDTQHNSGQPLRSNTDSQGHQRSKFVTYCAEEHKNSLQCIENNYNQKQICQPFFDAYKVCRKKEHELKLAENARLSGGGDGSNACIIS